MSEGLTFAGFAAMFRLGPEKITMTKADAVRLAEVAQVASDEITRLRAKNARLRDAINEALTEEIAWEGGQWSHEPILLNEAPAEAIKRLINFRVQMGRQVEREQLQAENSRLREAMEMARECLEDKDVIGARLTLTKALGEKE